MTERTRFRQIAKFIGRHLEASGLKPLRLREEESYADGWWTKVAKWSDKRPTVCLWFDRSLGRQNRVFWIGFNSPNRHLVGDLLRECRPILPDDPVQLGDKDWEPAVDDYFRLKAARVEQVTATGGLAYETYTNEEDESDYFGANEDAFNPHSEEEFATKAVEFIRGIVDYVDPTLQEEQDIRKVEQTESDPAVREALIKARIGQGKFRSDLFDLWGGCAVTGCIVPEVLRASHVKPWRKCRGKKERLDKNNGLMLVANLDALFDKGLISFDNNGVMLVSPKLGANQKSLLLNPERLKLCKHPSPEQLFYMHSHREEVFQR